MAFEHKVTEGDYKSINFGNINQMTLKQFDTAIKFFKGRISEIGSDKSLSVPVRDSIKAKYNNRLHKLLAAQMKLRAAILECNKNPRSLDKRVSVEQSTLASLNKRVVDTNVFGNTDDLWRRYNWTSTGQAFRFASALIVSFVPPLLGLIGGVAIFKKWLKKHREQKMAKTAIMQEMSKLQEEVQEQRKENEGVDADKILNGEKFTDKEIQYLVDNPGKYRQLMGLINSKDLTLSQRNKLIQLRTAVLKYAKDNGLDNDETKADRDEIENEKKKEEIKKSNDSLYNSIQSLKEFSDEQMTFLINNPNKLNELIKNANSREYDDRQDFIKTQISRVKAFAREKGLSGKNFEETDKEMVERREREEKVIDEAIKYCRELSAEQKEQIANNPGKFAEIKDLLNKRSLSGTEKAYIKNLVSEIEKIGKEQHLEGFEEKPEPEKTDKEKEEEFIADRDRNITEAIKGTNSIGEAEIQYLAELGTIEAARDYIQNLASKIKRFEGTPNRAAIVDILKKVQKQIDKEMESQEQIDNLNLEDEEPEQGNPQQGNPQQGNPQQGNPQQGNPEQSNPEQGNPQQGNPQQGNTQQGNPEQGNPQAEKWGKFVEGIEDKKQQIVLKQIYDKLLTINKEGAGKSSASHLDLVSTLNGIESVIDKKVESGEIKLDGDKIKELKTLIKEIEKINEEDLERKKAKEPEQRKEQSAQQEEEQQGLK